MANFVIKKDGTRAPFEEGKLRRVVRAAALAAGLEEERVNELVEQVSTAVIQSVGERETVPTTELRDKIVNELDLLEPSAAEAWRRHEQEKRGV